MRDENVNDFATYLELSSAPRVENTTKPLLAVVIPVYKQPQYLIDATISAVRQSVRRLTKIIIVNDGCPYPSTDWLGKYFQDAFPSEVYYLRKSNGGLSSARNYGIRFALATWPSIRAIFPLDADNKLSPTTLEKLWQRLATSQADIGWAYQDLTFFGTEDTLCHTGVPFSVYRLIHENFCEAGNLVHRRVFDAGVSYDEEMKNGYEDWEFYINASLRGFKGVHVPNTKFLYRKHGHSMLASSKSVHATVYNYIQKKHAKSIQHNSLALLEHEEMPRVALVTVDAGTVVYVTNPLDTEAPELPVSNFTDAVAAWATEHSPQTTYVPPIALFVRKDVRDFLTNLRILPGLLFMIQKLLWRTDYASINFEPCSSPDLAEVKDYSETEGVPIMYAWLPRKWLELNHIFGDQLDDLIKGPGLNTKTVTLRVGASFFGKRYHDLFSSLMQERLAVQEVTIRRLREQLAASESKSDESRTTLDALQSKPSAHGATAGEQVGLLDMVREVLNSLAMKLRTASDEGLPIRRKSENVLKHWFTPSHTNFAVYKHVDQGQTSFPYCFRPERAAGKSLNVLFILPWLKLGGVERCVLSLAQQLAKFNTGHRLHLAFTESNEVNANPEMLLPFDTLTFMPPEEADKYAFLVDLLSWADVVINAHSLAGYELLSEIKRKSRTRFISYLHVIDLDERGNPCGYPLIASRRFENLIDHYLVVSHRLRRYCLNLGVPDEKISVLPNAPAVSPPSRAAALRIAREKCRRVYSAERPIKILFSGRFDYQKGVDRLERIATQLTEAKMPFDLRLIGKPIMSRWDLPLAIPGADFLPATNDEQELARHYTEADIFLLPSRWEGLPLTVLEAMSFGNIVISTEVGAIGEVVENGRTGFLIDADQSEDDLVEAMHKLITNIFADPGQYKQLRLKAYRKAMEASWTQSAASLKRLLDNID